MIARLRQEHGSSLVVVMGVLFIVFTIGFATISWADNGFRTTREERVRESAFNLADAAVRAQIRELSRAWPDASGGGTYHCSNTQQATRCPSQETISQSYSSTDYTGSSWSTDVQDNGGSVQNVYKTSLASSQPGYDANGDGRLWIKAQATVRGKTRRVLTQVQARKEHIPFHTGVLTAGFLQTTNMGNKLLVDTDGTTPDGPGAGTLAVRCSPTTTPCPTYPEQQVQPNNVISPYSDGDVLSSCEIDTLKAIAKQNGTYYNGTCPANLTGAIVFIETGPCPNAGGSYNNGTFNNPSTPGMIVLNRGTISFGGNVTYYGLIYAHNATGLTGAVVSLQGTPCIQGAIAVDGPGGVSVGSSGSGCPDPLNSSQRGGNLVYDSNVFNAVLGYGSAEMLPGTWRELGPND